MVVPDISTKHDLCKNTRLGLGDTFIVTRFDRRSNLATQHVYAFNSSCPGSRIPCRPIYKAYGSFLRVTLIIGTLFRNRLGIKSNLGGMIHPVTPSVFSTQSTGLELCEWILTLSSISTGARS